MIDTVFNTSLPVSRSWDLFYNRSSKVIVIIEIRKAHAGNLLQNYFVHHPVVRNRVFLVLALLLSKTVASHLIVSVYALQSQCHILWLKLGKRRVICNLIRDVGKFYILDQNLPTGTPGVGLPTFRLWRHIFNIRYIILRGFILDICLTLLGEWSSFLNFLSRGRSFVCPVALDGLGRGCWSLRTFCLGVCSFHTQRSAMSGF